MSHHQVIAVALEMKGDNVYLRTKGGLDVGIKNTFIPNREQNGVEIIISNVQNETDEEYAFPLNNKLKYDVPEMKNLKKSYLTDEEIDFFREYLDFSKLCENDQVMEYWQSLLDEEEME